MKVAAITDRRQCALIDKPRPKAKGEYVVIKVHVAPMCNEHLAYSDLDFRERNRPDSLGHEAAGEVVEVAGTDRVKVGDRVVALCGYPCGRCPVCRTGYYAHCGRTVNPLEETASEAGECGFAQYMLKQDWLLVPIPGEMSYEHASMACCGLGPTFGAMQLMGVEACSTVLITGLGQVGLGGVINGVHRGARVIGVARQPYRSALARTLGATAVIDPRDPDALEQIRDLTGGEGADYAIETTSGAAYQRLAIDAVRRKGQVTFLAEAGELTIHVERDLIAKGLTLRGHLDLNLKDVAKIMRTIADVGDQLDLYITHRFPLSRIGDAWELQTTGECGKIILYPWSGGE